MYEIRTQTELLLFYQYASSNPAMWACLENARIEHATLGGGTVVDYIPPRDITSEPKVSVLFDTARATSTNNRQTLLALPFLFTKELLRSLTVPSAVVEPFRTFTAQSRQNSVDSPSRHAPARKNNWRAFREILVRYHIDGLYHFTDSRNLASVEKYGGLYSWWQCKRRGIRVTEPGGSSLSRRLDQSKGLQDYVRLSFNFSQPMMHLAVRDRGIRGPAILEIDPSVVFLETTLFSNVNATDGRACVGGDLESFRRVRFRIATDQYWSGNEEKKFFQAEVLVKSHIPLDMIKNL